MNKKSKLILLVVALIFVGIIAVKPFIKSSNTQSLQGGIDQNSDYAQALADAKAKGEPVFLEFFGTTWPSCQAMRPVVQAMAEKYGTKIRFIVADVATTSGTDLANQFQVMNIPSMFFIDKSGTTVDNYVGAMPNDDLEARLKKLIQ